MTTGRQIVLGSAVLCVCVVVHVAVLGMGIQAVAWLGTMERPGSGAWRWTTLILLASGVVLIGHTLQVWFWAFLFRSLDALEEWSDAVYFSLVNFTTLGYGDVILSAEHAILGPMEAWNGILMLALAASFLITVLRDLGEARVRRRGT